MTKAEQWIIDQKEKVSDRDYKLLNKAVKILLENVCDGIEYPWYPYRCIRPFGGDSMTIGKSGIWNWDTAFHALGVMKWDTVLAKEQILGFIQYQLDNGMFIDMICADGRMNIASSKPPLFAWAAVKIYEKDGDKTFIRKIYDKLCKNEEFWRKYRCYDGMFYYGADMNYVPFEELDLYARYESGWDNSVRWDLLCSDYWAIDLNCFMVMMYRSLKTMAKILDKEVDVKVFETREIALAEMINTYLWNSDLKIYTDCNRFNKKHSNIVTPASFMPLYIEIASDDYAAYAAEYGANEKKFFPGMPTVSYDDPEYSQDYWRGNTWLNTAYFAAVGLKNYGYEETAEGIKQTILQWIEKDENCIHENYDSYTGRGLYCSEFSWSSVFVIEFIVNF